MAATANGINIGTALQSADACGLSIPGLRTWRVAGFPLLWCCFERADHLDVVRLPGERQDIAAILGDEFASR